MEVTFLGTSAMVPTRNRNHPGVLLTYGGENILIDCGENIQRQLRIGGVSPAKITKLLVSHWHGDHVLGIPGLIQSLSASDYQRTLEIYGPERSKNFMKKIVSAFLLKGKIDFVVNEVKGKFFENEDFVLEAYLMKHTVPCLAFSFIEKDKRRVNVGYVKKFGLERHPLLGELQKGKDIFYNGKKIKAKDATIIKKGRKVTYITDTEFIAGCIKVAKDADLLVCEATYSKELEEKAREYQHLTAEQAAEIAKKAGVKKLVLTHFSQRYKSVGKLEKEAKEVFKNTFISKDFMKVNV
ncbi:MAG: ribonuclease Z [Candidatus Woesearchaeota archaeon]